MTSFKHYDLPTLVLYTVISLFGLINIYDVCYDTNSGFYVRQCIWLLVSLLAFVVMMFIDTRVYYSLAYTSFLITVFLTLLTIFIGRVTRGHSAWIDIGIFKIQPVEFLKVTCSLAIAKQLDKTRNKMPNSTVGLWIFAILGLSVGCVILQGDLGSTLVFSSFVFVLFIVGFPIITFIYLFVVIVIGILSIFFSLETLFICALCCYVIALIRRKYVKQLLLIVILAVCTLISAKFVGKVILKPRHLTRISALFNADKDVLGTSWNIMQSKIAIGSGGLLGKGFMRGTQTRYGFIPAQRTDFIFCTIGEEYGFLGVLIFMGVFLMLLFRLMYLAGRQKDNFSRVYTYCVVSVLFFHFAVNISMTIGLFPIIGIPLPFISYGGSALLAFSIMIFIALNLDASRNE